MHILYIITFLDVIRLLLQTCDIPISQDMISPHSPLGGFLKILVELLLRQALRQPIQLANYSLIHTWHEEWKIYCRCMGARICFNCLSRKHDTFTQGWFYVGPASQTVNQHWTNNRSTSRICWSSRKSGLCYKVIRLNDWKGLYTVIYSNAMAPLYISDRNKIIEWHQSRQILLLLKHQL